MQRTLRNVACLAVLGLAGCTSSAPTLYPYYLPPLQRTLGEQSAVAALLALAGTLVAVGAVAGPDVGPGHVPRSPTPRA